MADTSGAVESQDTVKAAGPWPRGIGAITLFVEDLATTKSFYEAVFGLPLIFEDEVSAVFKFENTLINLLNVSEAPELIQPAAVASAESGARMQSPDVPILALAAGHVQAGRMLRALGAGHARSWPCGRACPLLGALDGPRRDWAHCSRHWRACPGSVIGSQALTDGGHVQWWGGGSGPGCHAVSAAGSCL